VALDPDVAAEQPLEPRIENEKVRSLDLAEMHALASRLTSPRVAQIAGRGKHPPTPRLALSRLCRGRTRARLHDNSMAGVEI